MIPETDRESGLSPSASLRIRRKRLFRRYNSHQRAVSPLFPVVPRCSPLFPVVPRCSPLFPVVPRCSPLFPVVPRCSPEAALARTMSRYGQMAPVVVCLREETPEILDGFKRLAAARTIADWTTLSARLMEADERLAKAAIYGLNQAGRHTQELEEAWIVFALVREDGLKQQEAAELLGRHKSWVCRRLALLERLDGGGNAGTNFDWACWVRRPHDRWCRCPQATRSRFLVARGAKG